MHYRLKVSPELKGILTLHVVPASVKVVNFENDHISTHQSCETNQGMPTRGKLDQNIACEAPSYPWPLAVSFPGIARHLFRSSSPQASIFI